MRVSKCLTTSRARSTKTKQLPPDKNKELPTFVAKLKGKQAEMLEAYQNIASAQQKLDDYIQLQKADDVVMNELSGIVGVNRDKITQSTTDIANIANEIEKLFPAKGAASP